MTTCVATTDALYKEGPFLNCTSKKFIKSPIVMSLSTPFYHTTTSDTENGIGNKYLFFI